MWWGTRGYVIFQMLQRARFLVLRALMALNVALAFTGDAHADNRVALIIGNATYRNVATLANTRNDAQDMAEALRSLGWTVIEGIDVDKPSMDSKIKEFSLVLANAEVGVFFYAGHGLQVSGINYLVPIDAELSTTEGLEFEVVRLDQVQRIMESKTRTNILFLDACRNNPFARNLARALGTRSTAIGRGLAPSESGTGTLIAYSTQPGNVALDGEGRNSPFTGPLIKRIVTKGEDILTTLTGVRRDVLAATGEKQVPWDTNALTDKFFFNPGPADEHGAAAVQRSEAAQAWSLIKDTEEPSVLETYLQQFPNTIYAVLAKQSLDKLKSSPNKSTNQPGASDRACPNLAKRDALDCLVVGPGQPSTICVEPGTRLCGPTGGDVAVIKRIENNAIVYSVNGGYEIDCNTTELCSFKWEEAVPPRFHVRVYQKQKGFIASLATRN